MRVLLDTYAVFWSLEAPSKINTTAMSAMADPANDRVLSAATGWELAIEVGQGKIALSLPYRLWMEKAIGDLALTLMPVTVAYAQRQSILPRHHGDPFDRLLIAQALEQGVPIVSVDAAFDPNGVTRLS